MLLHWAILEPSKDGGLAAIRFTSPVRIKTVRIFPTGYHPFSNDLSIIARTEPSSFVFNVLLNAQPMTPGAKANHKVPNTLISTELAYTGGCVEFAADIGTEYATRLLVVQADEHDPFHYMSLAVYGDVASEMSPPQAFYAPSLLPSLETTKLNPMLDVANSRDPTHLARQLLSLIPGAPPLPLVIRLMFCLKASNDDWEHPNFPYLHADTTMSEEDPSLQELCNRTMRSVPDDMSSDDLSSFASVLEKRLNLEDPDCAYWVSRILLNSASQHPMLAGFLLQHLKQPNSVFTAAKIDSDTLNSLCDSAANEQIAQYLGIHNIPDFILHYITDTEQVQLARKLIKRIHGWRAFDDSLLNTNGNFAEAAMTVAELGTEERSLGIWLECMVTHSELVYKLREAPVLPDPIPPPGLLSNPESDVSHDEFIAFVRAFLGISAVLAVYAWADSVPNETCRERTLSILRLWQKTKGYGPIVNHVMLLRQMTFRLGCMMDNDTPTRSGLLATRIFVDLAQEPKSMLKPGLREAIVGLPDNPFHIDDDQLSLLVRMAELADEDLITATDELTQDLEQPLSRDRLLTMRVALAMINQAMVDKAGGEWLFTSISRRTEGHGILLQLIDTFLVVSDGLEAHLDRSKPTQTSQEHLCQILLASQEALSIIANLLPLHPLPSRAIRSLTVQLVDVFTLTDTLNATFSDSNPVFMASQLMRQACMSVVRMLCMVHEEREGKLCAFHVVQTLLQTALQSGGNPTHRLSQVFILLDHVLPLGTEDGMEIDQLRSVWAVRIIPDIISDIRPVFRVLEAADRVHLITRLLHLDEGLTGIGEYLLQEELSHLNHTLSVIEPGSSRSQDLAEYDVAMSLSFLKCLLCDTSAPTHWTSVVSGNSNLYSVLISSLLSLTKLRLTSPHLAPLVMHMVKNANAPPDLVYALVLALLFVSQEEGADCAERASAIVLAAQVADSMLDEQSNRSLLREEFTRSLVIYAQSHAPSQMDEETTQFVFQLLSRFGIDASIAASCVTWNIFSDHIIDSLGGETAIEARSLLAVEDETMDDHQSVTYPKQLTTVVNIPLADLLALFESEPSAPTTPPQRPTKELTPDVLAMVTTSPTALLRSPESITGLTKTYTSNSFRELRATPAARQNTSRLPSRHVDDFQSEEVAAATSIATMPFNTQLGAAFSMNMSL